MLAITFACVFVPASIAGGFADVVQRQTNDRDQDLIDSLILRQRFQDAIEICGAELKRATPRSDKAAKWAIRFSTVLTSQLESEGQVTDDAIAKAEQPVTQLLDAYADHPRKLFLRVCLARVQAAAARHAVVIHSVSPSNESRLEAVFTELARSTRRFEELVQEIDQERSRLDSGAGSLEQKSLSSDLLRLRNELQVEIVSLALLQTDIFPPESRDQLAAASKAKQNADVALAKLPPGSPARFEIQRLRIQALLRSGDFALAETSLIELAQEIDKPIPARVFALRIDLDLAQDQLSDAAKRLQSWYGEKPGESQRSIEMDLTRLAYLIATKDGSVGTWLEAIEKRNGAYARRRAEAISLGTLRTGQTANAVDPAIIAAQGADWLRRGDADRAATLLAASARAEPRSDLAVKRSLEAAAAFQQAKKPAEAAEILADIALAHPSTAQSSNAHLQAAVVISGSGLSDAAKKVESVLRQNLTTWPRSESATKSRRWLVTLLERQGRQREAAQSATSFLDAESTASEVNAALGLWTNYVVESDHATERIAEFRESFTPVLLLPTVAERYHFAAVYLLELDELSQVQMVGEGKTSEDKFTKDLLDFRRQQSSFDLLNKPPAALVDAARWRLMRDGKQDPKRRKTIADLLSTWGSDWSDQIPLLVWAGQVEKAHQLTEQTVSKADNPVLAWQLLAQSLAETSQIESKKQAIKIWDQLAAGLPKRSDDWHQAKLTAIELLQATGDRQEAARRAKYILLTAAPGNAELRKRYQFVADLLP